MIFLFTTEKYEEMKGTKKKESMDLLVHVFKKKLVLFLHDQKKYRADSRYTYF